MLTNQTADIGRISLYIFRYTGQTDGLIVIGFYIFQYEDISGRYGSVTAYVDWIDRNVQAPETSFPVENTSSLGQSL